MKNVTLVAEVDKDKCTGCRTCVRVCPTLSMSISGKKAHVDAKTCIGCGACEQRCPEYAIKLIPLKQPRRLYVDPASVDQAEIAALCRKARLHPEQIICYCTASRAEEAAAAIIKGARSPEDISRVTGIRGGCKVECIQPMLRLLEAAGIQPERPKGGWQWYGRTPTVWDIPDAVKQKYNARGFYFDQDVKLLDQVVASKKSGKEAHHA